MGTWIGHVDEAAFFILIALWWIFHIFPGYINARMDKRRFTPRFSYPLPNKPSIPIEAMLKTGFPLIGFFAEILDDGPHFIDDKGNFQHLNHLQHMSIYGIFVIHGIIDTFMRIGVPLPEGLDYFSVALSFAWYGISFLFHVSMPGKSPLEKVIHTLPVYIMLSLVFIILIEYWKPDCFLATLGRIYCLLVLGTWFIHTSFIMYIPPNHRPNPNWDRQDHRNVHFVVAAFGYHLIMHVFVLTACFLIFHLFVKRSRRNKMCHSQEGENLLCETDLDEIRVKS